MARKTYIYVGNWTVKSAGNAGGIGVYEYDAATGAISFIENVRKDIVAGMLCVDPKRKVVYSIDETQNSEPFGKFGGGGRVVALSVDPATGKLTTLNEQPSFGTLTTYVAVNGAGDYIVVANHGDKQAITKTYQTEDGRYHVTTDFSDVNAALYPLNEDGSVGNACHLMPFVPDRSFNPPHIACLHSVYFAPNSDIMMMSNMKQSYFCMLKIDREAKKLVELGKIMCPEGNWPRYGVFHPTKKLFYMNNEHALEISVIKYDEQGHLEFLQTIPAKPTFFIDRTGKRGLQQTDIRISHDGKFLYAADRGGGVINTFAVDSETGLLTQIHSLKLEGEAPRGFEISPDGRFMLVADPEAGTVSTVAIGDDGIPSLTGILDHSLINPAPISFLTVEV